MADYRQYLRALVFLREVYPNMTPLQMYLLLACRHDNDVRQTLVAEAMDCDVSTVVKAVTKLSDYDRRGITGLGLMVVEVDPDNRRERILRLTQAGQRVVDKVERTLA